MIKLIKSLFRKNRTGIIVIILFITLSVFLMTTGLSIFAKSGDFYDEKLAELDGPTGLIYLYVPHNVNENFDALPVERISNRYVEKLSKLDVFSKVQKDRALQIGKNFYYKFEGDDGARQFARFLDYNESPTFPLTISEKYDKKGEGVPIYLTSFEKIKNKKYLGQQIEFSIAGESHKGYVAGFYEHMMHLYNSSMLYTDAEGMAYFNDLARSKDIVDRSVASYLVSFQYKNFGFESKNTVISQMNIIAERVKEEMLVELEASGIPAALAKHLKLNVFYSDIDNIIPSSEPYILLMSVIMMAFSLLITIIALIILRFLIKSGIDDDIRNIGILKGLGFTTAELRRSYLVMYSVLLGMGALIGVIVGIATIPLFSKVVTILANLNMVVPINAYAPIVAISVTLGICLLAVYTATRKLTKVTPLHAIRGETYMSKIKKNHFPLFKSKLSVNFALSMKSIVNSKRQSIIIGSISTIVAFVCAFSSVCFYNMNIDKTAMLNLSGYEVFDVGVGVNFSEDDLSSKIPDEERDAFFEKIVASDYVDDYTYEIGSFSSIFASLRGEVNCNLVVSYDYSKLRTQGVYEGRYPSEGNEIAMPGHIAKKMQINLGDTLDITLNDVTLHCTVVGFSQSIYNNNAIHITKESYAEYFAYEDDPLAKFKDQISIYLKDASMFDAYIDFIAKTIQDDNLGQNFYVFDGKKNVEQSVFSMVAPATSLLLGVVMVVTAIVVTAVIFMIIRIKMIREKRSMAINKALGFTSMNISGQISLSILLVTVPCVLLGGLLGGLLTPLIIMMLGKYIGLMKIVFSVSYWLIFAICAVIIGVTYAISCLSAISTRYITPRMLVGK